ncbi:sigma 54-interacting transcriptional regulator [Anaerotruncus rubiinfantis]|uniref:sigma 54-interacting transcriptional regulator n=1 Tax=Anaerotruncus rubiinfantis TaxID=1720200 RepID=UPI00082BD667|nr:sigma 54-interacting transcriptional regulator [Anaerotruncus rubiinfantis]
MNLFSLTKIKPSVDQYVKVIADLLHVEVDIIDYKLLRVSGTGKYAHDFYRQGNSYQWVLTHRQTLLIDHPREHERCAGCSNLDHCDDKVEITCPILLDGAAIGVISITTTDLARKEALCQNIDNYIAFLENIADLIASKAREYDISRQEELLSSLREKLINLISDGVILLDSQNHVQYLNHKAELLLANSLSQIQYLEKIRQFSIIQCTSILGTSAAEYLVRIREKQFTLSGEVHILRNERNELCKVFLFQGLDRKRDGFYEFSFLDDFNVHFLEGSSPRTIAMREQCERFAALDSDVLILGEVGSGKKVLGSLIHYKSKRREEPFKTIPCHITADSLLERELFSALETAPNGTLFIDEITLLPPHLQQRLLATIEDPNRTVRVIASSNQDLHQLAQSGGFLGELCYALESFTIFVPPLRSRREDIPLLVRQLLAAANRRSGKMVAFERDVIQLFIAYPWPGNVRELENTISAIVCEHDFDRRVSVSSLPHPIRQKLSRPPQIYDLKEIEKQTIRKALRDFEGLPGGKQKAIQALGISKATFYRKLERLGIRDQTKDE